MRPGKRHELIDGEYYVTPSPNTKHQDVSMNLGARGAADLLRYNQDVLACPLVRPFGLERQPSRGNRHDSHS